jgi:hypothetical protein
MQDFEKQIVVQYFHHTSELLKEVRHLVYQAPDMPLPERIGENANHILSDYADWIKDIKKVVEGQ